MGEPEWVVLVDDDGEATGTALKHEVHHADTPLHLAFSCYLTNGDGDILVTRRALSKKTWPGVWTNSFCGHPAPGEQMQSAIRRRGVQELKATLVSVELALPDFRYRAIDPAGIVENEICPVFLAVLDGEIDPDPAEVIEWAWISPDRLAAAVACAPFAFSPWLREQLPSLREQLPRLIATDALAGKTAHG